MLPDAVAALKHLALCTLQAEACLNLPRDSSAQVQLAEDVYGPFTGQVTAVARQAFRRALMEADPRLVEAMFLCEVTTSSEALSGGTHALCLCIEQCTEHETLNTAVAPRHWYRPCEVTNRSEAVSASELLRRHIVLDL